MDFDDTVYKNTVVLVDENDVVVGSADKLDAHEKGLLHRAVSVYITSGDYVLIQKRAVQKYHSGDLWSNAACTHPRLNESNADAAERALYEELRLKTPLIYKGSFLYKAHVGDLIEHEFDHVFIGHLLEKKDIVPNPDEASEVDWIQRDNLALRLKQNPHEYTPWFQGVLETVKG